MKWAAYSLATVWSIALLAWLGLYWVLMPRIDGWKPQIEARASAALGVRVSIGEIELPSSRWVPHITLRNITLTDGSGRPALRLPLVMASLSPQSLLSLEPRFEQLLLEGPELEVRRDPQGRLHVAGFTVDDEPAALSTEIEGSDWLLSQAEFVIRRGQLRWIDEMRQAPALQLSDVDLVLRNGLRSHDVRIDASPPPGWGRRFSLRGRFTQPVLARASDWSSWTGQLHADFPHADVEQLGRHVQLPFELQEGDGALRFWLDLDRGRVTSVVMDLALREVALRLDEPLEPLVLSQVRGRLSAQHRHTGREAASLRLDADDFGFSNGRGVVWPRGDMSLTLNLAGPEGKTRAALPEPAASSELGPLVARLLDLGQAADIRSGEFMAAELDVGLLSSMATRVPLGKALRDLLTELKPQGQLENFSGRWQGSLDAPTAYTVKGRLSGLALEPGLPASDGGAARPGLQGARIDLEARETGGQAQVKIDRGQLVLPGVFEQPQIPLDSLQAQVSWRIASAGKGPSFEVTVAKADFANADARGEFKGRWQSADEAGKPARSRFPGRLDMSGRLSDAQAVAVARYAPQGVEPQARHYLSHAVKAGRLQDVTFRIKGDLADFPYTKAGRPGEFSINGRWVDGVLAYIPTEPGWVSPWPEATRVQGRFQFDARRLEFKEVQGRIAGMEVPRLSGSVRVVGPDSPFLSLEGQARGSATDFLRYAAATPIRDWTEQALVSASASGNLALSLRMDMPLLEGSPRGKVRGSVQLSGNDIRLRPELPLLAASRGRVDFSERGFSVVGAQAQVAGGELAMEGGVQPDGVIRFIGQGTTTADGLRRMPEFGGLQPWTASLRGRTAYRLALALPKGRPQWTLTSTMAGMEIGLPEPLYKPAEAVLPLKVQLWPLPAVGGGGEREQMDLDLGAAASGPALLRSRLLYESTPGGWQLMQGALGVGDEMPAMAATLPAQLRLERLDVGAWQQALERFGDAAGSANAKAPALGATDSPYAPKQIRLRARELLFEGRRLNQVVASVQRDAATGLWRADVEAEQLAGRIEYRPPAAAAAGTADAGQVQARLSRMSLPPAESAQIEELLDTPSSRVPALDVVIEDFELRGKKLGRVEIEAVHRAAAGPRGLNSAEWRLDRFRISNPDATLNATGRWSGGAPTQPGASTSAALPAPAAPAPPDTARRRTRMDFKLELKDSGALIERMGLGAALKGGKGSMDGEISWLGSPLSFNVPTLEGRMKLALDAGKFLKADAGAARLLGVLSLQSLPRRLLLDFRDVFDEGFLFDNITGDVTIASGVAHTSNLRMRGIQATVVMEGSADIARETQDLRVLVVPEINAGTASLAYTAINPALGLSTFLAQLVLRRPLIMANTREFQVSGSWDDPKVERLERSTMTDGEQGADPGAGSNQKPAAPGAAGSTGATGGR